MEKSFTASTEASPAELFSVVGDLGTYPGWLDVVSGAEPVEPTAAGEPVWMVTLRARIGPLSRSKRLRMCRTVHVESDDGGQVVFERRETDGRDHSAWVMSARVNAPAAGDDPRWRSTVTLTLRYDGALWTGLLDGLLDAAAITATENLRRHVAA